MTDFMTVAELLELPSIPGLEVIAGKNGLERHISTVTVVDTPDGATWIKGGEFVITTAFAVKDDNALITELLYQLHKSNAAGLGIKSGRFIKDIPEETKRVADLLSFPLIIIPEKYAFADIITPVLSMVVNRQSVQLMRSNEMHKEYLELAVNDESVTEILKRLSKQTSCDAAFIDCCFETAYFSDDGSCLAQELRNVKCKNLQPESVLHPCFLVANKTDRFGYIVLSTYENSELSGTTQTALEYATMVLIIRMQKRISHRRIEEKYKDLFLEDILTNNVKTENEIHNRAHLYGWNFENGGLVAIVDINNIKKYYIKSFDSKLNNKLEESVSYIFNTAIDCMLAVFPNAKYYRQSDLICFIISPDGKTFERSMTEERLETVFANIRSSIEQKSPFTVTLGVGSYFSNIKDIHTSYAQARTSIQMGYQLERFDCILFYWRMGIYRLLADISEKMEATDFINRLIKPLLDYDAKYNSMLMATLGAVIRSGWNLKTASTLLFIHYNSVKYRFGKICELLEIDPHNHEQCLELEIAYKLYLVHNHKWRF